MANPQAENGHLDIANEIVEQLGLLRLAGSEWQIIWVVLRKTWGWHKKQDWISLTQLERLTGISRKGVCVAKNKLVNKRILLNTEKGLMFNKNYENWVVNKKTPLVNKTGMGVVYKRTHTKETIQKKLLAAPPQEIISIFNIFKEINPTINYGNKTQRQACVDLIKQFGHEKTLQYAKYAVSKYGVQYAPTITTPLELVRKYAALNSYFLKNS